MLEHFAYLNYSENRPASWQDFTSFEANNKLYKLKYGTIRNNFYYLKRAGKIRLEYRTVNSYYVLSDFAMTTGQIWVRPLAITNNNAKSKQLASLIERMPFDKQAVHDIHLRFHCPGLWNALHQSQNSKIMPISKDLILKPIKLDTGITGQITIHKTDTAMVRIACSKNPIYLDQDGLVTLNTSLARIHQNLLTLTDESLQEITHPNTWTLVMWHLGRDSLQRYNGKNFEITMSEFNGEVLRAYSKAFAHDKSRTKTLVRLEEIQRPHRALQDVIRQKLRGGGGDNKI